MKFQNGSERSRKDQKGSESFKRLKKFKKGTENYITVQKGKVKKGTERH